MTAQLEIIPIKSTPFKNQLVIHYTFTHGDADFTTTEQWAMKETNDVQSLSPLFISLHELVKLKYNFSRLSTLEQQKAFLITICNKNGLSVKADPNETLGLSYDHSNEILLAVLEKVDIIYYGDKGEPCYSVVLKQQ